MRKIIILGSTGSVGKNALDITARHKKRFKIIGLSANDNIGLLARQANRFGVRNIALGKESLSGELKKSLKSPARIFKGADGISELASLREADVVLMAISGVSSVFPLIAAIKAKKRIALANKEAVVSAGGIIMDMARSRGAEIIPVDSEHNSIFQCLEGRNGKNIKKVFLMGSGGPLKDVPRNLFDTLKPSRILSHPVWKMGKKISVDSATMMNKGLEIIEASRLFGIEPSKIEVLFHPEAIVHSMVEFSDGNVIANLFYPDMRMPIFYAFNYPDRNASRIPALNFSKIQKLSFQKPDFGKFPALKLCYEALEKGGTFPACLNGANEEAVRLYLEKKIVFSGIVNMVKKVFKMHKNISAPSLDEILRADKWSRREVRRLAGERVVEGGLF